MKLVPCATLLLLGACAASPTPRPGSAIEQTSDLPAPDPRDIGGSMQNVYYVGPADKLSIFVSDLPDMTQTVMVDPSGNVSLPIVGQLKAGGLTTEQIRAEITRRLAANVLVHPTVSVGMVDTTSQKITIDGAVSRPGAFAVTGSTTLVRALAVAGGPSGLANPHEVIVYRKVGDKQMAALFDLKMIRQGDLNDPVIYGNDVIMVGTSRTRQALRDIGLLFPLLGAFYTVNRITQ